MVFFDKGFIDFFKGLRSNNDRDWFQDHKKEYEKHVKEPFKAFVGHLILKLQELDPEIRIEPKQAIFRIYRDIRFSKDKSPYKEHVSAAISKGGRKDMTNPGLYIQCNDEEIRFYSGVYMPSKEHLEAIRHAIAQRPEDFQKLYNERNFKKIYGEIRGEKNKRLPKDLKEAGEVEPLIYNKGFYYFNSLPAKSLLKSGLDEIAVEHFQVARPLNQFFKDAIATT